MGLKRKQTNKQTNKQATQTNAGSQAFTINDKQ